MDRTESSPQAVSLLPFLQPSNHAPRLVLTKGTTDASYPFVLVDDSAPFSRVIRGSFRTAADSRLKDVFLVLQRDRYRLEDTTFSPLTNMNIEDSWQNTRSRAVAAVGADALIELVPRTDNSDRMRAFAPLLFCSEKQLFMPLLCPSCGRELELCRNDELLLQKGLYPYGTSVRRYLYCSSCSSSGSGEFFVREREDADPLFLSDCRDLVDRLRLLAGSKDATDKLPCAACAERSTCFGSENRVRGRLAPFSFYPFQLLIVDAPALNALDFTALLSGATGRALSEQLDSRVYPGRVASLSDIEEAGPVIWTNFIRVDERAFAELLFLKLSLLEEAVGRIAAEAITPPRGERVWVYLPRVCRNLPLGWNFRLLFTDELTPVPTAHAVEHNPLMVMARTGLFYFQILLGSREVAGCQIIDAVRQYLAASGGDGGEEKGPALLKALCVPENIFREQGGFEMNSLHGELWDKACAAGYALLDAARNAGGSSRIAEIHHSLRTLTEETRGSIFSTGQRADAPVGSDLDTAAAQSRIARIVAEMVTRCRTEIREKPQAPPDDRSDEIVETIILPVGAPPEPVVAPNITWEEYATVIIPSGPPVEESTLELAAAADSELQETVLISPKNPVPPGAGAAVSQPPARAPEPVQDDFSETVMIIPPAGRYRPGGPR